MHEAQRQHGSEEGRQPSQNVLTIDPLSFLDVDDGLWLKEGVLSVAIADVPAMIEQNSPPDQRAARNSFSMYGRPYQPLFGHRLQSRMSLLSGTQRKANVIQFPVTRTNTLDTMNARVRPMEVVNKRMMDYVEAQRDLERGQSKIGRILKGIHAIAKNLFCRRPREHQLASAVYEQEERLAVHEAAQDAHQLVQEVMIATNMYLAKQLHGHPALYRHCHIEERGREVLLRASYDIEPGKHEGLNIEPYAHFTSPIRRFADVVNWRIALALEAGTQSPYSPDELIAIAGNLNAVEQMESYKGQKRIGRGRSFSAERNADPETTTADALERSCQRDEEPRGYMKVFLARKIPLRSHEPDSLQASQVLAILTMADPESKHWGKYVHGLLDRIIAHPRRARGLLREAELYRKWQVHMDAVPNGENTWNVSVCIVLGVFGSMQCDSVVCASSQEEAEEQASVQFWQRYVAKELPLLQHPVLIHKRTSKDSHE